MFDDNGWVVTIMSRALNPSQQMCDVTKPSVGCSLHLRCSGLLDGIYCRSCSDAWRRFQSDATRSREKLVKSRHNPSRHACNGKQRETTS